MGEAVFGVELEIDRAGVEFNGECEEGGGPHDAGDGWEEEGEVADVDEEIPGEDEIEAVGLFLEEGEQVGDVEVVVDVAVHGFADHGFGDVDADEAFGVGFDGGAAEAGAAA